MSVFHVVRPQSPERTTAHGRELFTSVFFGSFFAPSITWHLSLSPALLSYPIFSLFHIPFSDFSTCSVPAQWLVILDTLIVFTFTFTFLTVELSRVGGVNAPVGSRYPVYNSLCCWAIEVSDKWRHNDVIVLLKKLSISIKIHVVKPLCSVSKLSIESVGSQLRIHVHTADAGVGNVYWV